MSRDDLKAMHEAYLGRRNAQIVLQKLETMDAAVRALADLVRAQSAAIADLAARVGVIEQDRTMARVGAVGSGPTVK